MIETEGDAIFGLALNRAGTLALVLKGDDQILVVDTNVDSWTYHDVVGTVKVGGKPLKLFPHATASGRPAVYVGDREEPRRDSLRNQRGRLSLGASAKRRGEALSLSSLSLFARGARKTRS